MKFIGVCVVIELLRYWTRDPEVVGSNPDHWISDVNPNTSILAYQDGLTGILLICDLNK